MPHDASFSYDPTQPMPTFTWEQANIHPLEGAIWIARHRVYLPQIAPDKWQLELGPWQEGLLAADGCKPATGWKIPSGPGEGFYKTLRKLGYTRDPVIGDYQ